MKPLRSFKAHIRYGESYMFEVSYAGLNVCCGDAPDRGMYVGMRILF